MMRANVTQKYTSYHVKYTTGYDVLRILEAVASFDLRARVTDALSNPRPVWWSLNAANDRNWHMPAVDMFEVTELQPTMIASQMPMP